MGFRTTLASVARELTFATYLAPSIRPAYELVVREVAGRLGVTARLVTGRYLAQVRGEELDFAFVCGLPYVRLHGEEPRVEALAAPVLVGERYHDRPVYFSDVVVRHDSPYETFGDLRGATWAYNEPDSHSGYLVTLYRLCTIGERGEFFGATVMTGFHQESLRRVAAGEVDASAIDSQVLAVALVEDPELAGKIRVIDTLGPSTIQPLVATPRADDNLRREVAAAVTTLTAAGDESGTLAHTAIDRWVAVEDGRYDDIRAMLAEVEAAGLSF